MRRMSKSVLIGILRINLIDFRRCSAPLKKNRTGGFLTRILHVQRNYIYNILILFDSFSSYRKIEPKYATF